MKIKKITNELQNWAPLSYAEDFDNVGMIIGNENIECTGVLITIDITESVIEEAVKKNCNLIISFHPIIFNGIKKIIGEDYVQKIAIKAIQNKIAVFSIHTALDNHKNGVSYKVGEILSLKNQKILIPKKNTLKKLSLITPKENSEKILNKLYSTGAGKIGNYNNCSFKISGTGSFTGNSESNPTIGLPGKKTKINEEIINVMFKKDLENKILKTIDENHPYEEYSYEIYPIDNINQDIGMGTIGFLKPPQSFPEFISSVKSKMNCISIRHSKNLSKKISKVAIIGGSGSFGIEEAINQNADVFITSDIKYHDYFKAENKIILMDIGHFESEQFTKNLIQDYLTKKIPNFAFVLSKVHTNPINYF
tara:strand:- start:799 stop:1893 length:1095 start_codon:yes stop_codon:yes gene_type:complete